MNKKLLGSYKNGNYTVMLFEDGTKLRFNKEDYMRASRPESIDINISNRCVHKCEFCYQGCTPEGAIADFTSPLFDSIPPYTELALNGNGIFFGEDGYYRRDFEQFLYRMKENHVICNITIHINDFLLYQGLLLYWVRENLIHGIGVSINGGVSEKNIFCLQRFSNIVVHVVAGIVPWETLVKLSDNGIKLLILGYKDYGRGSTYLENHDVRANINQLKDRIGYLYKHFEVVSFDNLALEQLDVRSTISKEQWDMSYMGEDGSATFFIDAVANTYARSSISERIPIDVPDVNVLFGRIQNEIK